MPLIYNVKNALLEYPWAYRDGVFSQEEIQKITDMCSKLVLGEGTVANGDKWSKVSNVRRSKVCGLLPGPETMWIFERLGMFIQFLNYEFYQYDLTGFDYIQYGEYHAKDRGIYDWHADSIWGEMSEHPGLVRKLSMSLALNDDYEGGNFEIMTDSPNKVREPVPLPTGRMVCFPSYMLHRVSEVTKGCRRSLVVWALGPKFK